MRTLRSPAATLRARSAASAGSPPSWRITERMIQVAIAMATSSATAPEIHIAVLDLGHRGAGVGAGLLDQLALELISSSTAAK